MKVLLLFAAVNTLMPSTSWAETGLVADYPELPADARKVVERSAACRHFADEIASTLDVPPTNLSFHLKALTQAGMLTVEAEGRFQRYRANIPLMLDLIAYLTEECCSGHPEQCGDMRAASKCSDAVLPPLSSTQEALKK